MREKKSGALSKVQRLKKRLSQSFGKLGKVKVGLSCGVVTIQYAVSAAALDAQPIQNGVPSWSQHHDLSQNR